MSPSNTEAMVDPTATVTLVTPVYNQARFIGETIKSVLAQTYPYIDYTIIDDGSTDGTPAVIARFGSRITSVRQSNRGQAATLNLGWGEGRAKYLAYLSADDLLAPDAIARMVAVLETDPSAVCAYPDCDLVDARGVTIARGVCGAFSVERMVVDGRNPIGPGAVFRADAFRDLGGWRTDVTLGADDDFWLRMATLGQLRFVPEPLASYRVHRAALSRMRVSEVRACEPLCVVRDYFARDDVPAAIRAREAEAWANAHRRIATRMLRAGRLGATWRHRSRAAAFAATRRREETISFVTRLRVLRALAR